jgi:membrane protein implicated in regulation of membrane protease activity
MMNGLDGMVGPMMAWMMGYSVLIGLLVLVVLALLAVWLFQEVRRGRGSETRSASSRTDAGSR